MLLTVCLSLFVFFFLINPTTTPTFAIMAEVCSHEYYSGGVCWCMDWADCSSSDEEEVTLEQINPPSPVAKADSSSQKEEESVVNVETVCESSLEEQLAKINKKLAEMAIAKEAEEKKRQAEERKQQGEEKLNEIKLIIESMSDSDKLELAQLMRDIVCPTYAKLAAKNVEHSESASKQEEAPKKVYTRVQKPWVKKTFKTRQVFILTPHPYFSELELKNRYYLFFKLKHCGELQFSFDLNRNSLNVSLNGNWAWASKRTAGSNFDAKRVLVKLKEVRDENETVIDSFLAQFE